MWLSWEGGGATALLAPQTRQKLNTDCSAASEVSKRANYEFEIIAFVVFIYFPGFSVDSRVRVSQLVSRCTVAYVAYWRSADYASLKGKVAILWNLTGNILVPVQIIGYLVIPDNGEQWF